MIVTEHEKVRKDLEKWVDRFGRTRNALMPILQETQKKYQYISPDAQQIIADLLNLHPVEVYGVVSFYSFLDTHKQGKFVIRLCRTISCDIAGKDRVARQLENDLGISFGETSEDGMFTLEWANCLGMCDQGPAVMINDEIHTRVTPEKVHNILQHCRSRFGLHALREQEEH